MPFICDADQYRYLISQSPRWLVRHNDIEGATRSLNRLTGLPVEDPALILELEDIQANLEAERLIGEASFIDCFKPSKNKILLRTLTGIFIQAWQQLTGIKLVLDFMSCRMFCSLTRRIQLHLLLWNYIFQSFGYQ